MAEKKRKPKAGALRTEVFAMRLDPRMKYLAEIAARKQRRSLANFVEWAIEQAVCNTYLSGDSDPESFSVTVAHVAGKLWAIDEADRLINLATTYPDLMTYEEQMIWRVICEHKTFNKELRALCGFMDGEEVARDRVRACWSEIKTYALEEVTVDQLNEALVASVNRFE